MYTHNQTTKLTITAIENTRKRTQKNATPEANKPAHLIKIHKNTAKKKPKPHALV